MAKKTKNKKMNRMGQQREELAGLHIYKDEHNRYVYYDVFSKNGYVLNDVQTYKTYSSRFIAGLIAGIIGASFEIGIYLSVILAIVVYGIMEFKFRSFLKKQTMVPNFKRKERPPRLLTAASDNTKKIYSKIGAYLAMSILLVLLVYTEPNYEAYIKYLCIGLSFASLCMAIFQIRALFFKRATPTLSDKK